MAESSVQQIQQRLTCSVCLDKFKQPKLLPCQHTFCLTPCLINLVDRQTRRIKCPECRTTHMLPLNGVESFPNNITLMGFLDLDLTNVESSSSNASNKCSQCSQRRDNLIKCLDCLKFFCNDCKSTHVIQLKNDTKQIVLNLRRTIPKLSEKVGNFEQKQTIVKQSFESIKHDITSIIEKLIEELRTRERCLHAEAEVYMQSQLRTVGLEQENAEIELASVSSFCDASDAALNRQEQTQDNEIALLKKQGINYNEEMKNLNQSLNTAVNKLKFKALNLDDLFSVIQNFGELTLLVHNTNYNGNTSNNNQENNNNNNNMNMNTNRNPQAIQNGVNIPNNISNNTLNQNSQNLNATIPQSDFRRRRPTWNRNNRDIEYVNSNEETNLNNTLPMANSYRNNNQSSHLTSRSIFGPSPFASNNNDNNANQNNRQSRSDTERQNQRNQSNPPPRPGSRPIFGGGGGGAAPVSITARSADHNNSHRSPSPSISNRRPRLARSGTFDLDNPSTDSTPHVRVPQNQDNANTSELYNVRRRPRARSPVTFAVMLNEPESNIHFDVPTNNTILSEPLLNNPSIDYTSKVRAKQIIGKQGRDQGDFVWPIGVSVNPIGKHILVADSNNHRVQIFETNGRFVKSVGSQGNRDGQFECVSDVTVDAMANLYVVDRHNHRIQIFDRYCRFLRSLGSGPGSAPGELHFPWGICVNRFSEVFVCDKENNRVCVFHLTGRFLRSFGVLGTRPGQFDKPYYIHVTSENKVLVSDCSNHRIQIFDPYGNVLQCIGSEGSGPVQFKHPRGISTDAEGFILVADSGNSRIQVIRPDGSFVCEFGSAGSESGKFRGLEGIAVTSSGDVIVCDKENHRVQIL